MKRKRQDLNCDKDLFEQNEHPISSVQGNVVFNDDTIIDVETVSNIGIKRKKQNENREKELLNAIDPYQQKKTTDDKTASNFGMLKEKKENDNFEKKLLNGRNSYSFVQNEQNLPNQSCEIKTINDPKTSSDKNQKNQNKIPAKPNLVYYAKKTDLFPYKCNQCPEDFGTFPEVQKHVQTVHEEKKQDIEPEYHKNCGGNICVSKSSTVDKRKILKIQRKRKPADGTQFFRKAIKNSFLSKIKVQKENINNGKIVGSLNATTTVEKRKKSKAGKKWVSILRK